MIDKKFLLKQFVDVKKKGYEGLKNKINIVSIHIFWLPAYILNIPVLLVIKLLSPFIVIRFEKLKASFYGDVVQAVELYLCEKENKINTLQKRTLDIFFTDGKLCNKYLFKIFKRNIIILPKILIFPLYTLSSLNSYFSNHLIGNNSQSDRDINNLLDKTKTFFKLKKNEVDEGFKFLNSIGISRADKFVCINIREAKYHNKMDFHNYRNGDINKYLLACEELTKLGYYVFRVGSHPVKRIKSKNKMIIDYAHNGMRSEFLDIFLGSHCDFCISTSSGFDSVPIVSRKPILFITVPVGYFYTFSSKFMSITKNHYDLKNKEKLSLKEIFDRNVGFSLHSNNYKNNQVSLEDNDSDELKKIVLEFHDRMIKNIKYKDEKKIAKKFWDVYDKYTKNIMRKNAPLHGEYKAMVSISYLKMNKNFLD